MNIAIDLTETCNSARTGCANFTIKIVDALLENNALTKTPDAYSFYCRFSGRKQRQFCHTPANHDVRWFPRPLLPFGKTDIAHGFATHVPTFRSTVRVHTLFDVFSLLNESTQWQKEKTRKRKFKQYSKIADHADLVMTISESTKRDFLKYLDYPEERVRVVHGGVDDRFSPSQTSSEAVIRERYTLPDSYYLYIGSFEPRKNVLGLLKGYTASNPESQPPLVIAGPIDSFAEPVIEEASTSGLTKNVLFAGYIREEDKAALYACSSGFLFPTFYEGLGLPILEAMSSGVPVLAGNVGAAPEIAGEHAVMVDPHSTEAISNGIQALASRTDEQIEAARCHAATFTWQNCAAKTLSAYEWAIKNRR
jgi:glycosyltransferase involved in cell wall biosynthesis